MIFMTRVWLVWHMHRRFPLRSGFVNEEHSGGINIDWLCPQVTKKGDLIVVVERTRSAVQNREEALTKMQEMVEQAQIVPKVLTLLLRTSACIRPLASSGKREVHLAIA